MLEKLKGKIEGERTQECKGEQSKQTVAMIGETWDPRISKAIPLYQNEYPNSNVETFNAPDWLTKNKNSMTFVAVMVLNAGWTISQMARGRKIVDIGRDPDLVDVGKPVKPFYAMERVLTRFYPRRIRFHVPF